MALRLAVLKSVFNSYNTNAYPLIFLFIALMYFLKKGKKERSNLLIYEIFGILLLVMPFIGNKIVTLGAGMEANWPVYGILCAIPLTACMVTEVLQDAKSIKAKVGMLLVCLFAFGSVVGFQITDANFVTDAQVKQFSHKKISQTAVELAQIMELSEDAYVMAPKELAGDIREYSDEIRVFYTESYPAMQQDLTLLQSEMEYYGCNFVILNAGCDNKQIMLAGGYGERVRVQDYVIYKKNSQ